MDPLERLPPEIVLRILDFSSVSSLACCTRLNRSWHKFIDETNQEVIYLSQTSGLPGSSEHPATSFVRYFKGIESSKELCRRQTLLKRNWNDKQPITRESVYQIGNEPVWRFRADFKRRFFVSTSQKGGLNVTDMDTGSLLWHLSSEDVKPLAHLEYQDGVAIFDSANPLDAVEVWKTDLDGLPRGTFQRTAILSHDCEIRGLQLSNNTLCIASTEGEGFIYDMTRNPPELQTRLEIEDGAVGHVCQTSNVVMYCMGTRGYHIHDKASGALLGKIEPKTCSKTYHIDHPEGSSNSIVSTGSALSSIPSIDAYPPKQPNRARLTPLDIVDGPFAEAGGDGSIQPAENEWGAALLTGSLMVGTSRAGRVIICPDWRAALKDPSYLEKQAAIIETEPDTASFDIGGWLSVYNNRVMFEVQDQVYVVALNEDGTIPTSDAPSKRNSYSFPTSSATQLAVPVSFMELFDDCIMATYTTLGWRRPTGDPTQHMDQGGGIFPTKTIRVLSLAPTLTAHSVVEDSETLDPPRVNDEAHTAILEIMDMLSDEESSDASSEQSGAV